MGEIELKPCPFCRAALELVFTDHPGLSEQIEQWTHPHNDCVLSGHTFGTNQHGYIKRWNTRTPSDTGGDEREPCRHCNGSGTEADYDGLEMNCVEVACSFCNGHGTAPTPPKDSKRITELEATVDRLEGELARMKTVLSGTNEQLTEQFDLSTKYVALKEDIAAHILTANAEAAAVLHLREALQKIDTDKEEAGRVAHSAMASNDEAKMYRFLLKEAVETLEGCTHDNADLVRCIRDLIPAKLVGG